MVKGSRYNPVVRERAPFVVQVVVNDPQLAKGPNPVARIVVELLAGQDVVKRLFAILEMCV